MNSMKKIVGSLALAAVFVTSLGVTSFAQDWGRGRWEDRRDDRRDDRWDRNDRRGRNDRDDRYMRQQFEKGYRDGLDRGRKDAQTNRRRDPNNSSHYRDGNRFYRQGFERGFYEAFNQYSNSGRGRGRWGW